MFHIILSYGSFSLLKTLLWLKNRTAIKALFPYFNLSQSDYYLVFIYIYMYICSYYWINNIHDIYFFFGIYVAVIQEYVVVFSASISIMTDTK